MSMVSSSICELMMKIYCKDIGFYVSVYDIYALKVGFVFAGAWGELVEMVKKMQRTI